MRAWTIPLIALGLLTASVHASDDHSQKGLQQTPESFPIAVWLQAPGNAERYRAVGINTYVGLWRGLTEAQLGTLDRAGIRRICEQDEGSLRFRDRPTIVGWMHGDEPYNAQSLGRGKAYRPPILPAPIVEGYEKIRKADPDRPVLLNLGQGTAWDHYHGRGVRTYYPEYLKGCEIASFDVYPASHEKEEVAGNLWYVPQGVDRLRRRGGGK